MPLLTVLIICTYRMFNRFVFYFYYVAVIVEEATEIIEAEIVVPLFKSCDQLIMLGK